MRVIVLVLVSVFTLTGLLLAETTSNPTYTGRSTSLVNMENMLVRENCVTHTHQYTDNDTIADSNKNNFAYGAGLDLVVYESKPGRKGIKKALPNEVTIEGRYDVANQNGSAYLVAKYNLFDLFKKK